MTEIRELLTMDKIRVQGKTVLVRVDINSPMSPETKKITDDRRIMLHGSMTIKELAEKGAKVVVFGHQGRPGEIDFVTMEQHAPLLEKYAHAKVTYVDDLFGTRACGHIKNMHPGEITLLENTRFYSEELINRPAEMQAKSMMVQKLAPLCDYYVNDAFGVFHRSQPSLVGFGEVIPTVAGRVMESEIRSLNGVLHNTQKPVHFLLGGVKVKESIQVIKNLLKNDKADLILTGGLLGNLFLLAKGYDIGQRSYEIIRGKGIDQFLPDAQELVRTYDDRIEVPVDVAVHDGQRKDISISELPTAYAIADIGRETVGRYCKILESAKTIVMNSPVGRYEDPEYNYGTKSLINFVAKHNAFKVIGGGHSAEIVRKEDLESKFTHLSSGGRATLYYLSGEKIPVIEMLKKAKEKWEQKLH